MARIQTGEYVHVVATVKLNAETGKILYVNPATTTFESDAPRSQDVELVVEDGSGNVMHREAAIVRLSSCEGNDSDPTGLVQADLPKIEGMQQLALLVKGKEVSRYRASGEVPSLVATTAPTGGMELTSAAGAPDHRQMLTLEQAGILAPIVGITYSVQVKPDIGNNWNTISVGRSSPQVEIDRNQFAGAAKAEVRVIRTNGFDEHVIAQGTVDLF